MFKWLRNRFIFFFGVGRAEANGIIVVVGIILLSGIIPYLNNKIIARSEVHPDESRRLDSLVHVIEARIEIENKQSQPKLSLFNPNLADFKALRELGLSPMLSGRIVKFRENGGEFRKKEDLKRIYDLTDSIFEVLEPFIEIPRKKSSVNSNRKPAVKIEIMRFDLNNVDSSELIKINGIGPVLSGRIVRFRNALGGFVRMEQISEIYGIEDYAILNLMEGSYIDPDFTPRKLNINTATTGELSKHPYLDYNLSRVVTAYRDQHGHFESVDDLIKIHLIDKKLLDKLYPYLSK